MIYIRFDILFKTLKFSKILQIDKCSIFSDFLSFHYEKNYIFGISITCRFKKKYFQLPLIFFIFHHFLRRFFKWLNNFCKEKKLFFCDQHPLRPSLNFFQKNLKKKFSGPWPLNYHILVFYLAYIGIYQTPAGWYGQEPYLGPAHLWLWQNMGVWDEKIAPKWGGTANAQFRFSVSYGNFWFRFGFFCR